MNKTSKKMRLYGVAALVLGALAPACSCYPEPEQIIQPPAAVPAVPTKVSGAFLDAETLAPVTAEITVRARNKAGQTVNVLRTTDRKAANSFTVTEGVLAFSVAESATLPLDLVLVADAPGYFSTSTHLHIGAEGDFNFIARMVNATNPPEGVSVVEQSIGSADGTGTLPLAATVSTPAESNTGAATTVAVPAGTRVTTADGTPLTGQLVAQVAYFNNVDRSSLAAFPGGFDVNVPTGTGSAREDGVFISAGFTAVNISDSNGNHAASFNQPVAVTLGVPAATVNPETGEAIAAGDVVPFWSYNEATGRWSDEGTVTVADDGAGNLFAAGETDHLSYFNLDWFYGGSARCSLGRTVNITGNPNSLQMVLELTTATGYLKAYPVSDNDVSLLNAPANLEMTLTARFNGQAVGSVTAQDLCTGTAISLPVTLPNVTPASLEVTLAKVCAQDAAQRVAVPGAAVLVGAGGNVFYGYTDNAGKAAINGLVSPFSGTLYVFGYDGTSYPAEAVTLTAGVNTVEKLQTQECAVISGAGGNNP